MTLYCTKVFHPDLPHSYYVESTSTETTFEFSSTKAAFYKIPLLQARVYYSVYQVYHQYGQTRYRLAGIVRMNTRGIRNFVRA